MPKFDVFVAGKMFHIGEVMKGALEAYLWHDNGTNSREFLDKASNKLNEAKREIDEVLNTINKKDGE